MKKTKGFTLLEVLLALTVFAFAGTAIMNTASTSLMGTANLEMKTIASWVASNQLVEANLDKNWPPKKKTGTSEMLGIEWHWKLDVQATEDKNMRSISIEVREDENTKYPTASYVTYVSNPKAQK